MHQLLRRQLKKHAPVGPDEVPAEWARLLEAVSAAYDQNDSDRAMLERSLELSSAELLEKERLVDEQKRELQRSNTELEHFAYVASHDLQEPLRTVQSYMQLLKRRYGDKFDDDGREFIGFAIEGATRMRSLIEDLLDYARVASRAKPFEATPLAGVVEQVLQGLSVRLRERRASVEVGTLPTVLGDPRQLAQLLQNLIANAVKFQKQDVDPVVRITAEPSDEGVLVRVQDNGIGLAPEYGEKIFVIFQRLHSRDQYEGTGVGLAVCKKIVERHGGRIWVESEPGAGATFCFTLRGAERGAALAEEVSSHG